MTRSRNANGFSLIELMVVVAIVAILAGIVYPSYQESVRRGNRAEARAAMMNMSQLQERNFSDQGTYVGVAAGAVAAPWGSVNWSGTSFGSRKYDVTVSVPGGCGTSCMSYTITATPVSPYSDPSCGALTLANDGTKGSGGTAAVAACWK